MKTLFIPAKSKLKPEKSKILEISKKLPENLAIVYSIQYKEIAEEVRNLLSKNHNLFSFTQVLGCSKPQFPRNIQAIVLVSDGRFHAVSLAIETHLPIYIYDNQQFNQITSQEIQNIEKKQKASYLKFLNANKLGVLVSIKPGQENLKKALKFKNKQKGKKSYLFLGNEINFSDFENFPQIQSWVNTSCPRLDMNSDIVNVNRLI